MDKKIKINQYIDHTALKADLTLHEVATLCEQARVYQFYAVCVPGCFVKYAKKFLQGTNIKIAAVVAFPLGNSSTSSKIFETKEVIKDGADEIDVVVNISWIKSNHYELVEQELYELRKFSQGKVIKLILETCLLTDDEIFEVSKLAAKLHYDFVKTSTGFSKHGATFEAVEVMKKAIAGSFTKIKASGGIRDYPLAKAYISKGVSRIGTSSGVKIMIEESQNLITN
ncbi:deoxyribose-phosphate aldolase [Mycoplasma sp. SG1]|uniref:deoxyribose-phosphate aldolase n=1 Tax=Mycoplasma sp. SG1 TaxID=2810348 RepID=UPI0020251A7D|nr:deoxyribose-phosphate aldolase [Mycoplasma sp. SG1]URM52764.1 deoxyribose-phosphate aldolase [Mycoplasma sp. SG1]